MAGYSRRKVSGLLGSQLKTIGIVSMGIDHIGAILLPALRDSGIIDQGNLYVAAYFILRFIGRLAFPIFAFLLVEGFFHTRSMKKYLCRLGMFAILSEIPFDMAVCKEIADFSMQNVFFTLFIGLLTMYYMKKWEKRTILRAVAAFSGIFLSWIIKADYGGCGIILVLMFYIFHQQKKEQMVSGAASMICMIAAKWEIGYLMALPLLYSYNGMQGKKKSYIGYWFYPVHLWILAGLRQIFL